MNRRTCLATLPALFAARRALAAVGVQAGNLGICTFSCHRAWQAVRDRSAAVPFSDGPSFYDYARTIGADGVQTGVATLDEPAAARFRDHVEQTGGYYEGDVRLPRREGELEKFEHEVKLARAAGATVARSVLLGSRRYETWKTLDEFKAFQAGAPKRLKMVEPVLKKHRVKLAIENHKDLTCDELAGLMRQVSSEWIGVNVDTGNNIALLDDPYYAVETLAPFAVTTHLKDMAVQPHDKGFLLSEITCGEGFLDLPRIAATLHKANGKVRFNLEMATRDPLLVPCLTDAFFATFPDRKASHLQAAMALVKANPPRHEPPSVAGKAVARQVGDEESNNRESLRWMHEHLGR